MRPKFTVARSMALVCNSSKVLLLVDEHRKLKIAPVRFQGQKDQLPLMLIYSIELDTLSTANQDIPPLHLVHRSISAGRGLLAIVSMRHSSFLHRKHNPRHSSKTLSTTIPRRSNSEKAPTMLLSSWKEANPQKNQIPLAEHIPYKVKSQFAKEMMAEFVATFVTMPLRALLHDASRAQQQSQRQLRHHRSVLGVGLLLRDHHRRRRLRCTPQPGRDHHTGAAQAAAVEEGAVLHPQPGRGRLRRRARGLHPVSPHVHRGGCAYVDAHHFRDVPARECEQLHVFPDGVRGDGVTDPGHFGAVGRAQPSHRTQGRATRRLSFGEHHRHGVRHEHGPGH
ncbi:unnamed protein product [Phytophthora lilii]|uniref:Unnamed protein product n=1 Tax=Phytophthora lilii TaxID=2077276 RepID=A0A9W6U287_9STRA|nr:unnamed protein product [Phytophthora lilii]